MDANAHSTSQKQVTEQLEAVNENLGKMNTRLENVEKMEGRLEKLEAAKTGPVKTDCTCAVA